MVHLQIITQEPRQDRECLLPSAFHPRGDLDARTSGVSPPSGCVGSCPAGQKTPVVKPSALLELSLSPYLSIDIRAPTLIFPWLTGHPVGRQKTGRFSSACPTLLEGDRPLARGQRQPDPCGTLQDVVRRVPLAQAPGDTGEDGSQ